MIRYVTVLVLSLFALGAWAQNSPPHQHAAAAADVIDGSLHPELIPDSIAFRLYLIALSEKDTTLTEPSEHQKVILGVAGLDDADIKVAAGILRTFRQRLDAITETYNKAVISTNDSSSDRALFVSKREALVQTARDAFTASLSSRGAAFLNTHVKNEKARMSADKNEAQQIAELSRIRSGYHLASFRSPQYGCNGYMNLHYNSYTTLTPDSHGKNIYGTIELDGYTGENNASYCYGINTHQGQLQLQIGSAGGWYYGQSVRPSSQISMYQNVTLLCDVCSVPVDLEIQGLVYCTVAGFFSILPPTTDYVTEDAVTKSIKTGGIAGAWTVSSHCTDASTPPDWDPTISTSAYEWPYYMSASVCSRARTAKAGTKWFCLPNPTPLVVGMVSTAKVGCTNYDAKIIGPTMP